MDVAFQNKSDGRHLFLLNQEVDLQQQEMVVVLYANTSEGINTNKT